MFVCESGQEFVATEPTLTIPEVATRHDHDRAGLGRCDDLAQRFVGVKSDYDVVVVRHRGHIVLVPSRHPSQHPAAWIDDIAIDVVLLREYPDRKSVV